MMTWVFLVRATRELLNVQLTSLNGRDIAEVTLGPLQNNEDSPIEVGFRVLTQSNIPIHGGAPRISYGQSHSTEYFIQCKPRDLHPIRLENPAPGEGL